MYALEFSEQIKDQLRHVPHTSCKSGEFGILPISLSGEQCGQWFIHRPYWKATLEPHIIYRSMK
jgi:hypothetical protein